MGRQRKTEQAPRFLTIAGGNLSDGGATQQQALIRLWTAIQSNNAVGTDGKKKPGRKMAWRPIRSAIYLALRLPLGDGPASSRRMGVRGSPIVPQRERRAVAALQETMKFEAMKADGRALSGSCDLTPDNATRIIEQARALLADDETQPVQRCIKFRS